MTMDQSDRYLYPSIHDPPRLDYQGGLQVKLAISDHSTHSIRFILVTQKMVSPETQAKVTDAAARVEEPIHEAHELLQGQVPGNPDKALGHPIHPSTVHWPIAVSPYFTSPITVHQETSLFLAVKPS